MCDAVVPGVKPAGAVGTRPENAIWTRNVCATMSRSRIAVPDPVDAVGGTSFAGDKMALKGMVAAAAEATDKTAAMSADATAKRFIQPPLDLHVTDLPCEGETSAQRMGLSLKILSVHSASRCRC